MWRTVAVAKSVEESVNNLCSSKGSEETVVEERSEDGSSLKEKRKM